MIDIIEKYVVGVLLAVLVGLGVYTVGLEFQKLDLEKQVATINTTLTSRNDAILTLTNNAKSTEAVVNQFQDSLNDLKSKEADREIAVKKAMDEVQELSKTHEEYSAQLLATIPKSSNMCSEADILVNSYLEKMRAGK